MINAEYQGTLREVQRRLTAQAPVRTWPEGHVFTRDDIRSMTPAEYAANRDRIAKQTSATMTRASWGSEGGVVAAGDGVVGSVAVPTTPRQVRYPEPTFTDEQIARMTPAEYAANRDAILAQFQGRTAPTQREIFEAKRREAGMFQAINQVQAEKLAAKEAAEKAEFERQRARAHERYARNQADRR